MPNAPRLVAAILFAALCFWAGDLLRTILPESLPGHQLAKTAALLGLLFGWKMLGARAGAGYVSTTGYALTTLGLVVLWGLVIFSAAEMVERSLRKFYDGPMEGLENMVELIIDYAQYLIVPDFMWPALIGAVFVGWVTEFTAQRAGIGE